MSATTRRSFPLATAICSAVAVLLASAPLVAIVQELTWLGAVLSAVLIVFAVGLLLHRAGPAVVAVGQLAGVLMLLTGRFTTSGVLTVLPGPGALRDLGGLLAGAGDQISTTVAPVPPTQEILFLITVAFGVVATAVHLAAVGMGAPAAAGVPLLATFAVPAALADDLLPWWAMLAAAAGFGLLLVARRGARRQSVGGVALVAVGGVLALGLGTLTSSFVGTSGRFANLDGPGGAGSSTGVGLSPFAALRGQLTQSAPTPLFEVAGLPRATYLRALTLRDFRAESGWTVSSPDAGPPLPGTLTTDPGDGEIVDLTVTNLAFRDYWLPLYGTPVTVGGLPAGRWLYDVRDGMAYTARPRQEEGWTERALLPNPTLAQLRAARGAAPGPEFLAVDRVDPRVGEIARQVVGDARTAVDRAVALQEHFSGAGTQFTYSLTTAPSGGDDALVEFLTVGRQGFCEQYASAMAVMLRTVGVPSRVAIGFTGGAQDGDRRLVGTGDAHAWVEAWFPGIGWTMFDPTPLADGRTIVPPYVAEALAERAGTDGAPADQLDPRNDGADPAPAPQEPPQAPEQQPPPDQAADGSGLALWPFVVAAALVAVALAVAAPAILRGRQRGRRLAAVAAGGQDAVGAAWAELLAESADRGVVPKPSDTVRGTARRMIREHRLGTDAQRAMRHLVGAVESSWYGGGHPRAGELAEPVRIVRDAIVTGTPMTMHERVLPRSVLQRPAPTGPATRDEERAPAPVGGL